MNKKENAYNLIFRDTVLGVLFFVASLVFVLFSTKATGATQATFIVLNSVLAVGGIYFLQKAFKKDKYRPQLL